MNEKCEGIVINEVDYRDSDAVITVYTDNYGIIPLYVRGYKKITGRNVLACQLFDVSEFLFDLKNGHMSTLKSAYLKNDHAGLKADYDKLTAASVIAEAARYLGSETDYRILKKLLELLESIDQNYLCINLMLCAVLRANGMSPEVDRCARCGSQNDIISFSIKEGGFLCRSCYDGTDGSIMDPQFLKKIRLTVKAPVEAYDKLPALELNDPEITDILLKFLETHGEIRLHSAGMLEYFRKNILPEGKL